MGIETEKSGESGETSGIFLATGITTVGTSGQVSVKTGAASGGAGGAITVAVGTGDTGNGGSLYLSSGDTTAESATGGTLTLHAGDGQATSGGAGRGLVLEGGDSYGTTDCDAFYYCGDGLLVSTNEYELAWGGTCKRECDSSFYGLDFVTCTSSTNSTVTMLTTKYEAILEGCTHACDGGMVVIRGGSTASAQGGPVHIYGRDSLSGSENAEGGLIEIRSGASTSNGGAINMITGHSTGTTSGALKVGSGVGTSSATSGTVDVFSGTTCTGDSGAVTMHTGAAETGTAGNLNLKIGDSGTGGGVGASGAVNGDVYIGLASYAVTIGPVDHTKTV